MRGRALQWASANGSLRGDGAKLQFDAYLK
jgi:hypothetical protein